MQISVITNDVGQAMLVSFEGWPDPPPSTLTLSSDGEALRVADEHGTLLGWACATASPGIMLARECYLGIVHPAGVEQVAQVQMLWA